MVLQKHVFVNCKFTGKICAKDSNYDESDFTGAELTAMWNISTSTFKKCNFTDSYYITCNSNSSLDLHTDSIEHDKQKLSGKLLIKHFVEVLGTDAKDSYYNSPNDGGYNPNDLDTDMWDL